MRAGCSLLSLRVSSHTEYLVDAILFAAGYEAERVGICFEQQLEAVLIRRKVERVLTLHDENMRDLPFTDPFQQD